MHVQRSYLDLLDATSVTGLANPIARVVVLIDEGRKLRPELDRPCGHGDTSLWAGGTDEQEMRNIKRAGECASRSLGKMPERER